MCDWIAKDITVATRVGWRQLCREDWNSLTQRWNELTITKKGLITIALLMGWGTIGRGVVFDEDWSKDVLELKGLGEPHCTERP